MIADPRLLRRPIRSVDRGRCLSRASSSRRRRTRPVSPRVASRGWSKGVRSISQAPCQGLRRGGITCCVGAGGRAPWTLKGRLLLWNSQAQKSSCAVSRKKASSTSSVIPAAQFSTSTTRSSRRTRCSTSWCGTSRLRSTPPTRIRAPPRRSVSAWSPADPASPTRSPASPPRTWTRSRWWSSPVRCRRTPSVRTPSRSATRSASRVRA